MVTVEVEQCVVGLSAEVGERGAARGLELDDTVALLGTVGEDHNLPAQGVRSCGALDCQELSAVVHWDSWAVDKACLRGMHRGLQGAVARYHGNERLAVAGHMG